MIEGLARLLDLGEAGIAGFILVFCRAAGVLGLLPGFGEQMIPARVRLGLAVALALATWPLISTLELPQRPFLVLVLIEAGVGLLLGLAVRLMVVALQLAGAIAAQSTALAQIFGATVGPEPMPAIGNILMLAGVTLAVVSGLHVKAVLLLARSFEVLPVGVPLPARDMAAWAVARLAQSFALGFALAAPFVIAAFAYNLALGAINRAMPQLMVAFIGAPAITAGAMLLLLLAAPVILQVWHGQFDATLADPLALPR